VRKPNDETNHHDKDTVAVGYPQSQLIGEQLYAGLLLFFVFHVRLI
jgi:hypothetical protein